MRVSASKHRPRWTDLPAPVRADIERLVGGRVAAAESCSGGFSPGFASRLTLAGGRRVFVKAIDGSAWPHEAPTYRDEIEVAAALPPGVPAPPLLGAYDDGSWVVLAFEHVDGHEPAQPWRADDLGRVLDMLRAVAATPVPVALAGRGHARLGGFTGVASDPERLSALRRRGRWAADRIGDLVELEAAGLVAARAGNGLAHFDAYPHNLLLTADRAVLVDWPHARAGAATVDVVTVLASAAATGADPEPYARAWPVDEISGVLAAYAGFCLAGGLGPAEPGLAPIIETKRTLGLAALAWLRHRL